MDTRTLRITGLPNRFVSLFSFFLLLFFSLSFSVKIAARLWLRCTVSFWYGRSASNLNIEANLRTCKNVGSASLQCKSRNFSHGDKSNDKWTNLIQTDKLIFGILDRSLFSCVVQIYANPTLNIDTRRPSLNESSFAKTRKNLTKTICLDLIKSQRTSNYLRTSVPPEAWDIDVESHGTITRPRSILPRRTRSRLLEEESKSPPEPWTTNGRKLRDAARSEVVRPTLTLSLSFSLRLPLSGTGPA